MIIERCFLSYRCYPQKPGAAKFPEDKSCSEWKRYLSFVQ